MKKHLLLFLLFLNLYPIDITINTGKEGESNYSYLHIIDNEEFNCSEKLGIDEKVSYILCTFNTIPKNRLASTNTTQFQIQSKSDLGKFYIMIKPKFNVRLTNIENNLIDDQYINKIQKDVSKHWIVISYDSTTPPFFSKSQPEEGLDFPVQVNSSILPHVGTLNFNKEPIFFETEDDIEDFLKIKRAYDKGTYDDLIADIESPIEKAKSEKSVFLSDMLLYKLKTLNKIGGENEANEIIELGVQWLKDYPSNENIAEVLWLIGRAYATKTMFDSGIKYFEEVIREHPNTLPSYLAMIDLADYYISKKRFTDAIKLYQDVLYNTKDLETASIAALKLAQRSESKNMMDDAAKYYEKIIAGNRDFFIATPQKSWNVAKSMADNNNFLLAANINETLYNKNLEELDDTRDEMLAKLGIWFRYAKDYTKAEEYFQKYLKVYGEDGSFKDTIQKEYDEMLFETLNDSDEEKLKRYDYLISTYEGQDIANKALYKKIKILFAQGRYNEILQLQYDLQKIPDEIADDKKELIYESAKWIAESILDKIVLQKQQITLEDEYNNPEIREIEKNNKTFCETSLNYIDKYNITTETSYDPKKFYCYNQLGLYNEATQLSKEHYSKGEIKERLKWMHNTLQTLKIQNKFNDIVVLSNDILSLAHSANITDYDIVLFDIFEANIKLLKGSDELIQLASNITTRFKDDIKNGIIYDKLIKIGSDKRDPLMVLTYSEKLINLQKINNTKKYSPSVEFSFLQALMDLDKLKEAKDVSLKMMDEKMKPEERAKLLYLRSNTLTRSGWPSQAKPLLEECSAMTIKSEWIELCKESKKWVE